MVEAPVPSQPWKMQAFVVTIVILFCTMVTLQIFVEPNFERDYRSISHSLPRMTQAVVDGAWLGDSVVLLLAACIATWRFRPTSRGRALAAWTAIAVGLLSIVGTMYALYLPFATTAR